MINIAFLFRLGKLTCQYPYMEDKLGLRIVCSYDEQGINYDRYLDGKRELSLEEVWERINGDVIVKPQPLKFVKKKEQL
jgi:hypothetical protein